MKKILECAPRVANNHVVALLSRFKYFDQKFVSVCNDQGWVNGVEVTLQVENFQTEVILVGRILLHALREKAHLNQAVGLKIIDIAGRELIKWPAEIQES